MAITAGSLLLSGLVLSSYGCGSESSTTNCGPAVGTSQNQGALLSMVRGNSKCETPVANLSGISQLTHSAQPNRQAFLSVGINFEHIISGKVDARNGYTPRLGFFPASQNSDGSETLLRQAVDCPWGIGVHLTYRTIAPHYIDFEFRPVFTDVTPFSVYPYVVFFFASYMMNVDGGGDYSFRGIPAAAQPEAWMDTSLVPALTGRGFAPENAADLPHEADSFLDTNLRFEAYPRIRKPFYCGGVNGGMGYQIMFDKLLNVASGEEIRFYVFKWIPGNPAWDFGYVIRNPQVGTPYRLRGRMVWKPFVSVDDCEAEYSAWLASLPA